MKLTKIQSITKFQVPNITVYDLEVSEDHSYTVTDKNVVVHNSMCKTRMKAGVGYPQLSCVAEVADACHGIGGRIISDGGCQVPGDIGKALGAGADFVMLGSMLAGHEEN